MDLLPKENAGYLTQTYWDDRYTREDPASEGYDWFKSYSDPELSRLLNLHIPLKSSRIIMLGCGNSTLGPEMHADGFERIVNVDYSPVCIQLMQKMHEGKEGMDWVVGDIMDLQFEEGSFDVAIDKGTMDALMSSEGGDVWNPPASVVENCRREVDEATRVLSSTGVFLYLTFGQPHFRKQHLVRPGWDLSIVEMGSGFNYYLYILKRSPVVV